MSTDTLPKPAITSEDARISDKVLEDRFRWLREFIELNGWGPSYRQMAKGWGMTHAAVKHNLRRMEKAGWIEQGESRPRLIRITRADNGQS